MMSRKGNYRLFPVAIIAMSIITILVSCFPRPKPSSGAKHSGLHQGENSLSTIFQRRWYYRNKLLIKIVHEKKWHISIKYDNGVNFTKDKKKELEKTVEEALRVWLAPVREYSKKDVVDDFEFIEKNPPHFRRYQKRKPQKPVDLEIAFKNRLGKSYFVSRLTDGLGMIRMYKEIEIPSSADSHVPQNASDYSWNTLLHELGHAFGLLDTYPGLLSIYGWGRKSTGGSWDTSGKHAESIMSGSVSFSIGKRAELTYDDKIGIQDLYRYYVLGYKDKRECSSEEFKWDKDSAGCIPKYPIIFAAKHGDKLTLLSILLSDPSVNVNETDPLGNTALHEAVMRGKDNVVGILLDMDMDMDKKIRYYRDLKGFRDLGIDVNIPNNDGETPLHFLVANGYSDTSERILNHLLRSSVDLSVKNNKGKTPYDHAKEYELISGGEHKFPDEFLDRLNPANVADGRNTDGKR